MLFCGKFAIFLEISVLINRLLYLHERAWWPVCAGNAFQIPLSCPRWAPARACWRAYWRWFELLRSLFISLDFDLRLSCCLRAKIWTRVPPGTTTITRLDPRHSAIFILVCRARIWIMYSDLKHVQWSESCTVIWIINSDLNHVQWSESCTVIWIMYSE